MGIEAQNDYKWRTTGKAPKGYGNQIIGGVSLISNDPYLLILGRSDIFLVDMYEDFHATDRWTGQKLHCVYQALIVAIATRHADAIDIKFLASGRPVWIALPHPTWVEYKERTGRVINDPLAIQIAGHFLKTAIESGTYEHGREMYTLTVDESLGHLNAVLKEVGAPHDALIKTA